MNSKEKLLFLEEIMDLDEGILNEDYLLSDIEEWDSLSALSFIVEMKKRFGINVETKQIKSFKTVSDICQMIPD